VICPFLIGLSAIMVWIMKAEWNGAEAQAGGDHWQAA
jgi:hypothetical protein